MAAFKLTKKEAADLDALAQAYEQAKSALSERLDEIATEWEEAFGERSDKWQEGEAGQTAQEKIDTVRGWFDEMPGEGEPQIDTDSLV